MIVRQRPSDGTSLSNEELERFRTEGHLGPYPLLSEAEIPQVLTDFGDTYTRIPWYKSLHLFDSACYRAAAHEAVVGRVSAILGPDVLLWATQVMVKPPDVGHRWHVDVETLEWESVNVWVALRNVTEASTIQLVPGSHLFPVTPQDLEASDGIDLADGDAVTAAAEAIAPGRGVLTVDMAPGEFVIFDGRTWHGSENRTERPRSALLSQYSRPDVTTRIPETFEQPVRWKKERPACVLVSGSDDHHLNHLVTPAPFRKNHYRRLRQRLRPTW